MRKPALNLKLILKMAKILALSSVRARRTKGLVPTGFAKSPTINLVVAAIAFPATAIIVANFGNLFLKGISLGAFVFQISIFLPSLMTLAAVMYGLLFEFSQSSSVG